MNKAVMIAALIVAGAGAAAAQVPGVAPMAPPQRIAMPDTRDGVVAMVRDHFARADANRDGFLARDEMRSMRAMHGGRAERRMAMRGMHRNKGMRGNPGAMFDRLDANRDNMISRDEFQRHHAMRAGRKAQRGAMHGKRMGMRHGGMMRRADADRDGRVSLAEAQAAALQRFDRVDLDRDGRITPQERQQRRQQMLQRRGQRAG
ncbi:EF-hand domain-containing protein [Sphingomonas mesophila]|uniref:EF-hand domain-containing protein n=1 Tax=Sphingomonas mesophila TaxID=2303576 RepID=UPI000E5887A3|nr:EF-hand domain-containing protein [Sphingomonas mesophila]